jgi:RNA polymerase sigma factor (sigma-70 family)
MTGDARQAALRDVDSLLRVGTVSGVGDGQLLARFADNPGGPVGEVSFAALVERHGAMVLRVCRQILGDEHEAQDASQATFLVLARRARSIARRESIAGWLYGVAIRVASRMRVSSIRRRRRERKRAEMEDAPSAAAEPGDGAGSLIDQERRAALHEELGRLPEHFRAALVLCYFEGLTQEQAADRLQCPLGTLQSRLARGRDKLKARLTRRGITASVALLGVEWTPAPAPTAWAEATVRAAIEFATKSGAAALGEGPAVAALAREVLRAMTLTKLKLALVATLTVALSGTIAMGWAARLAGGEGPDTPEPVLAAAPEAIGRSITGLVVDEQGHPVDGAVVRSFRSGNASEQSAIAANGSFTLSFPGAFRYDFVALVAEANGGNLMGVAWFKEPSDSRPPASVRIIVKPSRATTVRVRDIAGRPVAGASVEALDSDFRAQVTSGPDGIAILHIPSDSKVCWVTGLKSGVGFDYFENYRTLPPLDLKPLPAELTLTLDGSLTVRVHLTDSAGKPVRGAVISPTEVGKEGKLKYARTAYGETSAATTDDKGVAVFDWLPKERPVRFELRRGEFWSADYDIAEYRLNGPTELSARVLRNTRLSGVVRLPDGRPAPRILMQARGLGGDGVRYVRTSDDGTYALDVPPNQVYVVGVLDDTWAAPSRSGIVVRENAPQGGLDFALGKGTVVHGRVTGKSTHKPSAGVGVELTEKTGPPPTEFRRPLREGGFSRYKKTDADGQYSFRVPPGQYELRGLNGSRADTVSFPVQGEAEVIRDLELNVSEHEVYLTGVVVERTPTGDRPMRKARIQALRMGVQSGGSPTTTDEQGRFRMGRTAGELVVYARGIGGDGNMVAGSAAVPEGSNEVTVPLSPAATITGRVVDTNGKVQAGRDVGFRLDTGRDEARSGHWSMRTRTDDQGRFTFKGAPVGSGGTFRVAHQVEHPVDGAETVVSFHVMDAQPIELPDLVVPPVPPASAPSNTR